MSRILLLSRYDRKGASSRLRFFQYLPHLDAAGLEVTVAPLFGDDYLERFYSGGGTSGLMVARYFWARVARLIKASSYDLVWIEKELFPYVPAWLERLLIGSSARYVVDYDDAIFHNYDMHRLFFIRRLLGRKIDAVMRRASLVTAGNDYLAERAVRAGARRVEYLPTVIDLERYPVRDRQGEGGGRVVIGWIGSPATVAYLNSVAGALAAVCRDMDARVVVIGIKDLALPDVPVECRDWSEETEASEIAGIDIGIMPLPDAPWERGKCGYKLIQYMACRKPVVASPVGHNREIVRHGENGFLAATGSDWEEHLRTLVTDAERRSEMGRHGRRLVEEKYCIQKTAPVLVRWLKDIAGNQHH